ncbi:MAG TPA: TolC family protein [Candidatus Hydrothermia bacterium]|nr:TolC family protein [Candidatus Hydrothermae bacterium]MDD3649289.1 TolC family protein [Candidatus Hydrothermia bacterium]MDD5572636.1 TolC family protein [Candidatus Hydrothermia bacterium]HOK22704.1 TolC family protein [Candidatus Hydrothermia bacterium]HOL23413.1 TolC family protein [Candidatus Hydrothermia bacterium]
MMKLLLILFLSSQSADSIYLSYDNLIEVAEKYSPALKEIKFNLGASRTGIAGDIARFLGSGEFTISKTDITYQNPPQEITPLYSSYLTLSTNLLSTSNLFNTINSYFGFKSDEVNCQNLREQFILNLKTQYLNTIKLKKTLEAYSKAVERSKIYYDLVNERYKMGMVSKVDLLTAEIELKNAEINFLNSRNAYLKSLEQIKSLLGITASNAIELVDYIPKIDSIVPANPEELVNTAMKHNATLIGSKNLMNTARTNLIYTISSFVPQVSFGKTWYYQGSDIPEALSNYGETENWTIKAYINILNYPFSVVQQAQVERSLSYSYKKSVFDVAAKVRSAYDDLQYYFNTLDLAELRFEQAKSAYELASAQYKEGLVSILQLMDTEASLLQSEVGLIDAMYNYTIAKETLNFLVGTEVFR